MRISCAVLAAALFACGDASASHDAGDAALADGARDGAATDAATDGSSGDTGRPPIPEGALTIGTWNIEHLPKTSETIALAAEVIRAEQIDLLGVQEIVERADFDNLAGQLPNYQPIIAFDSRAPIRIGFMYRYDRFEVTEIERLFDDDFWAFPRPVLKARVLDLESGFDFIFMVVHLKAQIDEDSRMRRALAIERMEAWMAAEIATGDETDFVVVGDYNDELTDGDDNVFRPFLDAPESYRFLTLAPEEAGAHTFLPFRVMIDHILVSNSALDEYGAGTTEVLELDQTIMDYEARVSDHRPVITRFAF